MSINVNEPTVFPPKAGCFTTRLRQDFVGQAKLSGPYPRLYIIIYLLVTVAQRQSVALWRRMLRVQIPSVTPDFKSTITPTGSGSPPAAGLTVRNHLLSPRERTVEQIPSVTPDFKEA